MEQAATRRDIGEALKTLLAEFSVAHPPFDDKKRILQDLGIGGDDAEELLEEIHRKFGTRFKGFDCAEYFPGEHEAAGERWFRRLGFKDPYRPLRVEHLVDVIQQGCWFEPPPEAGPPPSGSQWRRYAVRGAVVLGMPICWTLMAVAIGEYGFGLSPGLSFLLFGIPAGAFFAIHMWRRLPVN